VKITNYIDHSCGRGIPGIVEAMKRDPDHAPRGMQSAIFGEQHDAVIDGHASRPSARDSARHRQRDTPKFSLPAFEDFTHPTASVSGYIRLVALTGGHLPIFIGKT
jgi:hypothetical protein